MKTPLVLLRAIALGGAVLLLDAAAPHPVKAQAGSTLPDPAVRCDAFQRVDYGSWTVLSPVTLDFGGVTMSFAPGQRFTVGTTTNGVAIPVILDRQCGNRSG